MKIWVVYGSTGEYSDRSEWPVFAFTTEKMAEEFCKLAQKRAKEYEIFSKGNYYNDIPKEYKNIDPNFEMDYTGTTYGIYEVELKDSLASR